VLRDKQLPVPLGDDFDVAARHFDGGLIIDRVYRHRQSGGPFFCIGYGSVRVILVIQMRNQRKVEKPRLWAIRKVLLISPCGVTNAMSSDLSALWLPLGGLR
jgi:hypothetical protein